MQWDKNDSGMQNKLHLFGFEKYINKENDGTTSKSGGQRQQHHINSVRWIWSIAIELEKQIIIMMMMIVMLVLVYLISFNLLDALFSINFLKSTLLCVILNFVMVIISTFI